MGIFSRLSDIVNANLNAMLDKAEDPGKIIRMVIQEMEDTLVEVRTNAARTIADKKKLQRRMGKLREEAVAWERKAELAVSKGREDLARAALTEKTNLESVVGKLDQDMEELEGHLAKLNDDIANLQAKLEDAKARRKALVMRHETVANRLQTREKLNDKRVNEALSKFDHLERKMDSMEGKVEAFDIGKPRTLHDEFAELESEDKIDEELARLKERMSNRESGS